MRHSALDRLIRFVTKPLAEIAAAMDCNAVAAELRRKVSQAIARASWPLVLQ
jgi:hypothetical protein